eukprot:gene12599-14155_t
MSAVPQDVIVLHAFSPSSIYIDRIETRTRPISVRSLGVDDYERGTFENRASAAAFDTRRPAALERNLTKEEFKEQVEQLNSKLRAHAALPRPDHYAGMLVGA